jgi:hypothetical protein
MGQMLRIVIFLVGMLSTRRPGGTAPVRPAGPYRRVAPPDPYPEDEDETWFVPSPPRPRAAGGPLRPSGTVPLPVQPDRRSRRLRIPRKLTWAAILIMAGLIFRKAIAWTVLAALSATLHLVGLNVHLPHVKFGWPWQSVTTGTTTDTNVGPWVLQKIQGISRPALGTENFNFTFTHKVSKNIGIWPCWYSATFATAGHASATVDLNPGPAWWAPASGHYRLQVLSRPAGGVPGRVSVAVVLPQPQLPQSVHDVTVDNTLSHPINVQHSWTYPGLGCGAMIRPQFSVSTLYGLAQNRAFAQVKRNPQVTGPLIKAAEAQAAQIIRNNFIQPTVNALGYTLDGFAIRWARS